jgi:uncharacterized protein (DUF1800 family)
MAQDSEAAIALNRFGLGARPGERVALGGGAREWLLRQTADPGAFLLKDATLPTRSEAILSYAALRDARRDSRKAPAMNDAARPMSDGSELGRLGDILVEEIAARANHGLTTPDGFAERLVWFWSNHFTVAATKALTVPLAGVYERDVIRAGLAGSFAEMHLAAMRHAGMLLYLDQAQSIGPNSFVGRRRKAGLNENLAREALELHTVGADGGYVQADVTEFARALTGWTIVGERTKRFAPGAMEGDFLFLDAAHEPGVRTVMGKRYAETGEAQGRAILADLARHPATARRVATKLARHFIADEPPPAAVAAIEKVFLDTQGHLPSVHKALIARPEAWSAAPRKFKTPNDFLVSALRLAGVPRVETRALVAAYALLGQRPFAAASPEGWSDVAAEWAAPDAVMKRLEWSQALAERVAARKAPSETARDILGPLVSPRTLDAVRRAQSAEQGMVLVLMSSEFQRR